MTVYVLWSVYTEINLGVYSTEELAQAEINKLITEGDFASFDIEPYELDRPIEWE